MATVLRRTHFDVDLFGALAALARVQAESRRMLRDLGGVARHAGAYRGPGVELLFRQAARACDLLCGALEAAARLPRGGPNLSEGALASFVDAACGPAGLSPRDIGIACGRAGWETDYLALEYALGQDPAAVFAVLEAFVAERLAPAVAA